jgi:hypothetical protein
MVKCLLLKLLLQKNKYPSSLISLYQSPDRTVATKLYHFNLDFNVNFCEKKEEDILFDLLTCLLQRFHVGFFKYINKCFLKTFLMFKIIFF